MQNIFQQEVTTGLLKRIEALRPDTKALWGKMNVSQMMTHCSMALEVASGKKKVKRVFIGRILGPFIKPNYFSDKPFGKSSPTAPEFVVNDARDFEKEKARLILEVKQFSSEGEAKCTTEPHAFFGPLTPQQWGISMYKHLDHHLRQFGV